MCMSNKYLLTTSGLEDTFYDVTSCFTMVTFIYMCRDFNQDISGDILI